MVLWQELWGSFLPIRKINKHCPDFLIILNYHELLNYSFMKKILVHLIFGIAIILFIGLAGCVAPPKEKPVTPTGIYDPNNPNQPATIQPNTTTSTGFVTDATPFVTASTTNIVSTTVVPTTPIIVDQVCLIYLTHLNMTFESNKTAKIFSLKNPPMYINYTIKKPFNITGTKQVRSKYTGAPETITFSYYSPYAYLEITVRDKITGEIYTQDGFGKSYGSMLNKTIRVSKPGELLLEFGGNNITSTVGVWVKPVENLNETVNNLSKIECRSQDYVKRINQ